MRKRIPKKDSITVLIDRAREGNLKAFDELVHRYRARLAALVQLRMGPSLRQKVELEDVLQEAFSRAYRSIESAKGRNERTFFGWLGLIVEHVVVDLARHFERRKAVPLIHDIASESPSPSKGLRRTERFERLKQALDSIKPEHREVILLARIEGLQLKEVAERMNRTTSAVAQLLSRALRKLRKAFGETESLYLGNDQMLYSEVEEIEE